MSLMELPAGVRRWRNLTEGAEKDIDLDRPPVIRHDSWHGAHYCEEEAILAHALHRFREPEVQQIILGRLRQVRQALAAAEETP